MVMNSHSATNQVVFQQTKSELMFVSLRINRLMGTWNCITKIKGKPLLITSYSSIPLMYITVLHLRQFYQLILSSYTTKLTGDHWLRCQ